MPHQGPTRPTASTPHHQDLAQVLDWLLAFADFSKVPMRRTCAWGVAGLVRLALLWAWSDEATLLQRFATARRITRLALGLHRRPAATYQAFLKLLRTRTTALAAVLIVALRRRMQADLADRFEIAGFATFAADGSRLQLPRTISNQAHFTVPRARGAKAKRRQRSAPTHDAAARRKKAEGPQMWLTTLWHVGTGLPWDWRLGPDDSSEREHLRQMIGALPAQALVLADAGFAGYETWQALIGSGRHLLVRVGANVHLLRELGDVRQHGAIVYLWPRDQAKRDQPPLVVRLVMVQEARHPMFLVTSVLEAKQLSDAQVVDLYRRRWGIEVFYRHFKGSFGRRKLRSHQADNAVVEATWSLLGLWAMSLHGQVELSFEAIPAERISVAGLLRAYQGVMRQFEAIPGGGDSLADRLGRATMDGYRRRCKTSRDYPRKKQVKPIGVPRIVSATPQQVEHAEKLRMLMSVG